MNVPVHHKNGTQQCNFSEPRDTYACTFVLYHVRSSRKYRMVSTRVSRHIKIQRNKSFQKKKRKCIGLLHYIFFNVVYGYQYY
jgi:hypothetical protein